MDDRVRTTLAQELAHLSRKLATTWQAQLSLAKRRPDLAAPLLTRTSVRQWRRARTQFLCEHM